MEERFLWSKLLFFFFFGKGTSYTHRLCPLFCPLSSTSVPHQLLYFPCLLPVTYLLPVLRYVVWAPLCRFRQTKTRTKTVKTVRDAMMNLPQFMGYVCVSLGLRFPHPSLPHSEDSLQMSLYPYFSLGHFPLLVCLGPPVDTDVLVAKNTSP